MEEKVEETYTEDGEKLLELIQQWIDENGSFFYCKNIVEDVKCTYR